MKTVNLNYKDGGWTFDPDELRSALASGKTKVLILNNPHNPTGKVFTLQELETISQILDDFPEVLVIADEVYEFLTFDSKPHHFFASIGDNWNRTVSIYSGGKMFSCTGWRIGWAIGPEPLLRLGGIIQNAAVFNAATPCQVAMARSFDQLLLGEQTDSQSEVPSFIEQMRMQFERNRDILVNLKLARLPWKPLLSEGGYFVIFDISDCIELIPQLYKTTHDFEEGVNKYRLNMPCGRIPYDLAFSRWMAVENGVTMIPLSFFYQQGSPAVCDNYVRLSIAKLPTSIEKFVSKMNEKFS